MKSGLIILVILITYSVNSIPQDGSHWFPLRNNIQPFTANFLEPKAGFEYLFDISKVQINIGATRDIYQYKMGKRIYSIGADLFTYTRARAQSNFKFPVETIDYMFGLNAGYRIFYMGIDYAIRVRLSHISAHLVDGLYESENEQWKNNREPFVYSKEFIETFSYLKTSGFRIYIGLTYIFHVIPEEIKKGIFQIGFDYYFLPFQIRPFNPSSTPFITPFLAYDFKLSGINNYSGNHIFKGGLVFSDGYLEGLSVFISYVSGNSVHGEFYDFSESYWAMGLNLDI